MKIEEDYEGVWKQILAQAQGNENVATGLLAQAIIKESPSIVDALNTSRNIAVTVPHEDFKLKALDRKITQAFLDKINLRIKSGSENENIEALMDLTFMVEHARGTAQQEALRLWVNQVSRLNDEGVATQLRQVVRENKPLRSFVDKAIDGIEVRRAAERQANR